MKPVLYTILLSVLSAPAVAQETPIFPKGEKGPANHFTGTVWIYTLVQVQDSLDCVGGSVTFEPGARTNWHKHPGGQVLLVTEGKGHYQEKGKPVRLIQKGDVVKCPSGVAHWHGASPDTKLTHIAMATNAEKGNTEWLEKVTDEQYHNIKTPAVIGRNAEQEIIRLSKEKWRWMSERKVDSLAVLFHEKAVFVHMGATMSRNQELDVIKSGGIQYKNVDIQEVSVRFVGNTAILLNKIRLLAVVGGNEVTNPFVVTEVYVKQGAAWKLGSMSFTRLLTQ